MSEDDGDRGGVKANVRESFVRAQDGTQIYLRERGDRSAVFTLLCDGIACDGFIWKYLWDQLAERTSVAHFNYRGHGRSQAPVDKERNGIEDHSRDLDAVRAALGDPEVILIGHSMGCQVVLENYRMHRDRVKALVLICGASGRVTHTFKGSDALAQLLPRLTELVDRHPHLTRALWGGVPPELALKVAFALGEVDAARMKPADLIPYLEHMVDMDLPMFLRMLRKAGDHSALDLLPEIEVPVLVIASDRDSFTPPHLAHEMAKAMPKGEILMLSGTHAAPLEQPDAVHERIQLFFDEVMEPATELGAAAAVTPA